MSLGLPLSSGANKSYLNGVSLIQAFPFTVMGWMQFSTIPSAGNYRDVWDTQGDIGIGLKASNLNIGSATIDQTGATTIAAGQWYHYCLVRLTKTTFTAFLNGKVEINGTMSDGGTATAMNLGIYDTAGTGSMGGSQEGLKIWQRVLSLDQIKAEMYFLEPQSEDQLLGYWPLEYYAPPNRQIEGRWGARNWVNNSNATLPLTTGKPCPLLSRGVSFDNDFLLDFANPSTAVDTGAGAATVTFSPAGVGAADIKGDGAATVTVTAAGVGRADIIGAGALTITFTAAGVGRADITGAGAATVTISPAGVGLADISGAGAATVTLTAAGTSLADKAGAGASTFTVTAAGVGLADIAGAGASTSTFTASGAGRADISGAGSATVSFTANGVGEAGAGDTGAGAASITFTATAESQADATGAGAATVSFTAAGVSQEETPTGGGGGVYYVPAARRKSQRKAAWQDELTFRPTVKDRTPGSRLERITLTLPGPKLTAQSYGTARERVAATFPGPQVTGATEGVSCRENELVAVVTEMGRQVMAQRWRTELVALMGLDGLLFDEPTDLMAYSDDQPRDDHGRFGSGGAGEATKTFDSTKDANKWAKENVKRSEALTTHENNAVQDYRRQGHLDINHLLRNGSHASITGKRLENAQAATVRLDSAIAKSTVEKAVIVQRGMTSDAKWDQSMVGRTVSDKGFTSTTLDKTIAVSFARSADQKLGDRSTIVEIHVPAGSKGLYLKERHESELLLPRGSRFKIVEISKSERGDTRVKVELLPHGKPAVKASARLEAKQRKPKKARKDWSRFVWKKGDLVVLKKKAKAHAH